MRESKIIYLVNEYLAREENISILRKEKDLLRKTASVPNIKGALFEAEHEINIQRTSILNIVKTLEEKGITKEDWEAAKKRHDFYTLEEYVRVVCPQK